MRYQRREMGKRDGPSKALRIEVRNKPQMGGRPLCLFKFIPRPSSAECGALPEQQAQASSGVHSHTDLEPPFPL